MIEIKFITVRKVNFFNWNSLKWRKLIELFYISLKNMSEKKNPKSILEVW